LVIRGVSAAKLAAWLPWFCFALAAAVVLSSENETAKVGLAFGATTFAISRVRASTALRMMQIAWIAACLAIVPVSLALHRLDVHNATWLQSTAQHRIIIWNRISEETMKSPMLGIGAGMTYWNYDDDASPKAGETFRRYSRDAHNVFLQTWFELGLVGATLLTLVGLAVLQKIERLGNSATPYGMALFASACATLASSWGMWRPWFVYMFAFAVVLFAIAIRSAIRAERTPGLEHAHA
jgi:O-antigen ligase